MLDQFLKDAYRLYGSGQTTEAERLCREIISQDPCQAEAVYLLAAIDQDAGREDEAAKGFGRAAELAPDNAVFANAWGESLHNLGRLDEAWNCYQKAVQLRPTYERAHNNLGRILNQRGQLVAAEQCFLTAIRLNPNYATAYSNLGGVLLAQGKPSAAIEHLRQALVNRLDYPEAHYNLGASLRSLGDPAAALPHLKEAIRLRPKYARAHLLLGHTFVDLGQMARAVDCFELAARWQPDDPMCHYELGNVQMLLERFDEARSAFTRAVELNPHDCRSFAQFCRLKSMILDWNNLAADHQRLWNDVTAELAAGRPSPIVPLFTFALPWSRHQLLTVAQSHARAYERLAISKPPTPPTSIAVRNPYDRIKIAYLSRDFYDHAVGHQIQGLFSRHNREEFEVHVYSFGPDDGSHYRRRIANDAEFFHDVTALRDDELTTRIRADGIQILVDLMGYTGLARTGCLARRSAPIQVNWLGYPGTMGADFIDYLIGDSVVTPPEHSDAYRECLVRLPHSYMPTDQSQPISDVHSGRTEQGLPPDGTVFCCFHSTYKITPTIFKVWMRILDQVSGSVAWFNVRHPTAQINLRQAACNLGISPDRLIFASHAADKSLHLSRLRLADLFLDTPQYNAHVTACDALWAGLPVLTCPGHTFASRVAASLLTAANKPELIAPDLQEFERRAVQLGNDRTALTIIRNRLATERATMPLFDTPRFVRNLEKAFREMWNIHESGRLPSAFNVVE